MLPLRNPRPMRNVASREIQIGPSALFFLRPGKLRKLTAANPRPQLQIALLGPTTLGPLSWWGCMWGGTRV